MPNNDDQNLNIDAGDSNLDEETGSSTIEDQTSTIEPPAEGGAHPNPDSNVEGQPSSDENLPVEEAGLLESPDEIGSDQKTSESVNQKEDDNSDTPTNTDPQISSDLSENAPAETPTSDIPAMEIPSQDTPGRWYVVHTYSAHENKVATTLRQRIESEHLKDKIFDVLVPTQDKIEIRGGKKASIKEKIFPGYILVKMILDDISWLAVRTTQGVTSFVGMGNKPTPISNEEVKTIVRFTQIAEPTFKQIFAVNDTIKIVDGPFAEFIGKVDSVDSEKGKVRVLVSIFGRETPVELDFLQVQKI